MVSATSNKGMRAGAAVGCLVTSSLFFAICNTAWRFGHGSAFALAGQRALVGVIFFAPVLVLGLRNGKVAALVRDPVAVAAVIASGSTMPAVATIFRWMTGPQAALVLAVTPVSIIVCGVLVYRRSPRALMPVLVSVIAAATAASVGGLGSFSSKQLIAAGAFVVLDTNSMMLIERARQRHDAMLIVAGGMVAGAVGCYGVFLVFQPSGSIAISGVVAASIVGIFGTSARALRAHALPHIGSAVTYSSAQMTAVGTAVGGIIVFSDSIGPLSAALGLVAAAASLVATVIAARPSLAQVQASEDEEISPDFTSR